MPNFKYPYQCLECGHRFDSTGTPKDCHICHTDGRVIDLREWEKENELFAMQFIAKLRRARIAAAMESGVYRVGKVLCV